MQSKAVMLSVRQGRSGEGRAVAPSSHNAEQLGAKFVDRRRQHALGLDARLARRVEPQQVHHDVANDGEIVGGVAAAYA